jgi:3'(2'), 5'-bisphosphate nucleotidase
MESIPELKVAIEAAIEAGKTTLKYFSAKPDFVSKADNSPLTLADLESNKIIIEKLKPLNIPMLSEECKQADFNIRKNWERYWLIDPLDGTREFINHRSEFTVNIALMENDYPSLGIIYLPVKDVLYFGIKGTGAFKVKHATENTIGNLLNKGRDIPEHSDDSTLRIVASRSHLDENTQQFIVKTKERYKTVKIRNYGSSYKLCMLAEGKADVYPRFGPTMEWDIAAGHAIAEAAGLKILEYPAFSNLRYNKENLLNPWFIAFNSKYKPVESL